MSTNYAQSQYGQQPPAPLGSLVFYTLEVDPNGRPLLQAPAVINGLNQDSTVDLFVFSRSGQLLMHNVKEGWGYGEWSRAALV